MIWSFGKLSNCKVSATGPKVFRLQTLPLATYLKCVNNVFYYLRRGDLHNG
jgi:hypothetical protein